MDLASFAVCGVKFPEPTQVCPRACQEFYGALGRRPLRTARLMFILVVMFSLEFSKLSHELSGGFLRRVSNEFQS